MKKYEKDLVVLTLKIKGCSTSKGGDIKPIHEASLIRKTIPIHDKGNLSPLLSYFYNIFGITKVLSETDVKP